FGNQKIEDWISNVVNDLVDKTLQYEIHEISISENENKSLIILHILEGVDKPYYSVIDRKPIVYLRKGTSVFTAKPSDIKEMFEAKKQNQVVDSKIDISQKAKGKKIQQIGVNHGKIINTDKVTNVTEVVYQPELHITDQEAKLIKDKIEEIVDINDKAGKFKTAKSKSSFFATTWQEFKNRFGVTKYTLIPKDKYQECLDWLQEQIARVHRPKLRKNNNEEWKKQNYGAIYAKSKQIGMEKQDLYNFAYEKLELKEPINSLKELSDVRLKKLYQILFSTKK
ncbi:MAG TPA: ORF6C domain-containing protein, partial [Rhodothermales bacterium]|nr:ORF6C domain-containing protein [Rhodothermales bacterium]